MKATPFLLALGITSHACKNLAHPETLSTIDHADSLRTILTSFRSSDTTGQPDSTFQENERFILSFIMLNKTGRDQRYIYTGTTSEIIILQDDSTIASEFRFIAFPQVVLSGILNADSTLIASWKAPLMLGGPPTYQLPPGTYQAEARVWAHFDNVSVQRPQRITITIVP